MRRALLLPIAAAALACVVGAAAATEAWQRSLMQAAPQVLWHVSAPIVGDFNCDGRPDRVVLGLGAGNEVLLAAFLRGDDQPPVLIRWREDKRERPLLRLQLEDGQAAGDRAPEGYRRSDHCAAFGVTDDEVDALHFYWNHKRKKLSSWSQ
jgi:hypothetical protein